MATTRSDGRKTRKELEEEEELNRIMRRRENEERRKAADRAVARAEILVTSQGYSAAKAGKDRGRVQDIIQRAAEAEPTTEAGRRKQEKVLGRADDFLRDADEFSGKPVGNYEPVKPAWKRREEAEKRREKQVREAKERGDKEFDKVVDGAKSRRRGQGSSEGDIQAVDYWKEWGSNVDGSKSRWTPFLDENDDRDLVQIQTPSGGYVSAKGDGISLNFDNSMSRDREKAQRLADARAKGREIRDRLDEEQANQLAGQLREKGIDIEPRKADGSFDATKAKGLLASATFDAWDYDKQLDRDAQAIARDSRSKLRILRGAAREGRATDKDLAEMRELERMVSLGENSRNRDGLEAGFWRTEAENQDRNRTAEVEKFRVLAESQQKQADAVRKKTESVGRPLSDEEIKGLGYPAWDDEAAWQELIQVNPAAAEVYKMRPVNVSRAGRAMSKALSAFA